MKIIKLLKSAVRLESALVVFVLSCSNTFFVRDFSSAGWRMYRGDVRNTGTAEGKVSSQLDLIWKFKTGGGIIATCLVTDRIVVVGGLDKKLYFLDPKAGQKLRVLSFSGSISGTPVLKDSLLFFGTQRGGDSFYALNLKNFKLVWEKRLKDISSSPIIHKEIVYVGAGDGSIRALQLKTGKEIWQFKTQDAVKASAALDSNMLWLGSLDNHMYCISQNKGELLWKFKSGGGIYSTAAVDEENLYFGSADGAV
ncbi:MAG: PQQ-binding-like beta-propeller repeat protein, partial [candidate division Zixibacteria bacterium]|nr:PQQ-binding-like beta-propeller repeat protein [candidate division Zixibacteria bacterium]